MPYLADGDISHGNLLAIDADYLHVKRLPAGSLARDVFGIAYQYTDITTGDVVHLLSFPAPVQVHTDGTSSINVGDPVKPSMTVDGIVMKASPGEDSIGIANESVPAIPGTMFWIFYKGYALQQSEAIAARVPAALWILGEDGEPGEIGFPGRMGLDGAAGSPGTAGPAGAAGRPGLSGEDGEDGQPGFPGVAGAPGATGSTGAPGAAGAAGMPGFFGEDGEDGQQGFPGVAGVPGATGSPGLPGATGPSGPPGPPGQDAEEPEPPMLIPGPQGAAGAAGGSLSLTTVEVSLGAAPTARRSGRFTIAGSGLTAGKPVTIQQANGPYTGKGTRADEAEMDQVLVTGKVLNATTIECFWSSRTRVRGNVKFDYAVSA